MQRGTIYISRDNCRVTVVGSISEGKIKRRAGGDHEHESAKDLIQTRNAKLQLYHDLRNCIVNGDGSHCEKLLAIDAIVAQSDAS